MKKSTLLALSVLIFIFAAISYSVYSIWTAAEARDDVAFNRDIKFTVSDKFVHSEGKTNHYMVSGHDWTGKYRTVEIMKNYHEAFKDEVTDFYYIQVGETYNLKCSGIQNYDTLNNWQCILIR